MSRLPTPGGDLNAWGTILNDYLLAAHTPGGRTRLELVTALPSSPADGETVVLTDSLASPTYRWLLRYAAGSSSAYKWEALGGSPLHAAVDADDDLGSALSSWLSGATPGPSVAVPLAGDYDVDWAFDASNAATVAMMASGLFNALGAPLSQAPYAVLSGGGGSGWWNNVARVDRVTVSAAGAVWLLYYQAVAANTHVARRRLRVRPVRVG